MGTYVEDKDWAGTELYFYASTFRISPDTEIGGLNVAWASCPCSSAGRLRRNGGNPDLLIEGEQEERDGLSGDSGVPLRDMGWKPMLHATYPVCPSSSTNSGIRKVDAEKYGNT